MDAPAEKNQDVVIVDYRMGNIGSVAKKLGMLGVKPVVSSDFHVIENATRIILPGVGHFATGMKMLEKLQLLEVLHDSALNRRIPVLGICLGMQLMARFSEEGNVDGLKWFEGEIRRFTPENEFTYKVPHLGWNTIDIKRENPLLKGFNSATSFYFVHAYHYSSGNKEDILATTSYSYEFPSIINKANIFGVQFHPEKSHGAGQLLLENFLKI